MCSNLSMDKSKQALAKAIKILGGRSPFASAMGKPGPTIDYWMSAAGRVPAEYCPTIERLTARKVTCEQLAPKVEWSVLRLMVAEE